MGWDRVWLAKQNLLCAQNSTVHTTTPHKAI